MQLFDGHVATIKAVIIEINVNRFLVKKISKTISSRLKLENTHELYNNEQQNQARKFSPIFLKLN